ncbi:MAG: S41 family peptidase [Gammaproteobacteria bacterium]
MIVHRLLFVALASLLAAPGRAALAYEVTATDRQQVIEQTAALIETRYVFADRGRALAEQLRRDAETDKWRDLNDPKLFAEAVTHRLRELSEDGHLSLDYSEKALPEDDAAAEESYSAGEMERWYGAHLNHGFEKIERLPGNVGYLDLRVFAPPDMAGDVAAAAMTLLAQSGALIVDLRQNGGGDGAMANLIAAYLLDDSRETSGSYNRPQDKHTRSTTPAWVPGRRYGAQKPVYILISNKTFSAAEGFAYDLQALGRAVIVGERSGGGAHPFEYRRVHPHFVLSLAEGRSINPITGGNWQGTGVTPDVPVPAGEALDEALELARKATGLSARR